MRDFKVEASFIGFLTDVLLFLNSKLPPEIYDKIYDGSSQTITEYDIGCGYDEAHIGLIKRRKQAKTAYIVYPSKVPTMKSLD